MNGQAGFTLIELVAVMALVGVLAATAVLRFSRNGTDLAVEADRLRAALRYAQSRALAADLAHGIRPNGAAYVLESADNRVLILPGDGDATHDLPAGMTITGNTVTFDPFGNPGAQNVVLTISLGGVSRSVTVLAHSGYAQ